MQSSFLTRLSRTRFLADLGAYACKICPLLHTKLLVLQESEDCSDPTISLFHGHRTPQISMRDYVMRISKYSKCSNICGVMAYSYMQRLAKVGSACR